MLVTKLKRRWDSLLNHSQIDNIAKQAEGLVMFQEIVTAYSESHRYYHNLNHLDHLFREMDTCESVSSEMQWASWYHDIIYKPGAKNNEKESMKKAATSMRKLKIAEPVIGKVSELIMATENHQGNKHDIETQLFLDADMAILGSDESMYFEYCQAVRKEHASIPDFLFKRGRKQFLLATMQKKTIFGSGFFNKKYEDAARSNIAKELGCSQ